MDEDRRLKRQQADVAGTLQKGLWHTGTPLNNGYYQHLSFDMLADTSFHVLTTEGILGRDVLGAK